MKIILATMVAWLEESRPKRTQDRLPTIPIRNPYYSIENF